MPFHCPECRNRSGLEINTSIELRPDGHWDEMTLQVVACRACGFSGLALYAESRRGSLETESWEHYGYRVDAGDVAQVRQAISGCPHPQEPRCDCPAHARLRQDAGAFREKPAFKMRLA